MVDELVSAYGSRFFVAAIGVLLALACLVLVMWFLKKRSPSPFMRGNRNRMPRLQVLDATAVDARRRLVLVRRDNVEHLIMIGGPTDLVIESRISEADGYAADADDHPRHQIAAAPQRPVAEMPPPAPALPRAEPRRPPEVAAAAPPMQASPARQATRQPPAAAYRREEPVAVAGDTSDQQTDSFFYDEFADDTTEEEDLADLLEASRERVFSEPEPAPVTQRAAQSLPIETQAAARPQRPAPAAATPAQTFSASDFARVLEEEMAMQMSAEQQAALTPARAAAPPPLPRPTVAPPRPVAPPLPTGRAAEPRRTAADLAPPRPIEERRPAAASAARPAAQPAARPQPSTASRPSPAATRPAAASGAKSGQPNLQNEIARIFGEMSTKREK
ncbi:flagellar biosynthetic protein FliO [Rhizobium sp. RU36D]|uniref:flagellar biosynthetic protein FliO n=1 Tax=Rhizobium sp. RU36D TaxID=1907415 RepID=UPI0009D872F8|nr:flagellar biosynthetic protein FliO [Rhizobium sp. RU36D]SMC80914.1 Flagellar biosynthesis protein, FliO [Rhizobium sp. RU36D]